MSEALAGDRYDEHQPAERFKLHLGGFTITKDSRINTQWNFNLVKAGYAWLFLHKRRYEMCQCSLSIINS